MTDERLRSLDRAARATPQDAAAGKALARAYQQAGDRRAAWFEFARVARLGDAEARTTLDTWAPRAHPAQVVTRRPGLPEKVRRREVELVGEVLEGDPVASDTRLVLPMRTHLLAVDPLDLTVHWKVDAQAWPVALRGDDVVHASGSTLVVRDGETGEALGQTPLAGRIVDVIVWGDRALVVHEAPGIRRVSVLDVGAALGRVLWSREWPANALELVRAARHRVVLVTRDRVEVVELESGKTTCARALMTQQPRSNRYERVCVADARGVLLEEITPDLAGGPASVRVSELDLGRLQPRWSVEQHASVLTPALGDGVALLAIRRTAEQEARNVVVDRMTGATRNLDERLNMDWVEWANDAAYVVEETGWSKEAVHEIAVSDPSTLARRSSLPLPVDPTQTVTLVPFAHAVVAVLTRRDRTTLVRIEADV
jgi:hypothetical protein